MNCFFLLANSVTMSYANPAMNTKVLFRHMITLDTSTILQGLLLLCYPDDLYWTGWLQLVCLSRGKLEICTL